ncbi:hypothetical protein ACSLOU_00595 [Enterobacter cloacae]|uniref:hypothetical protein n=1 Tax=Enterobacter cloacae TaxID=550 RepID=UPI003EE0E37E
MKQDNSPQSEDGQSLIAAQIAASKLRQRENALLRSKTGIRRTSSASTENSQVTERPPQVYQAPQINTPKDLHEVAKLVHGEFEKIAQSQSVLLSLWQRLSPVAVTSSSVYINNKASEPTGIQIGWEDTGALSYIDFQTGTGMDYDARLRVDAASTTTGSAQGTMTSYAASWNMNHNLHIRGGCSVNYHDSDSANAVSERVWNSEASSRGLTMEWNTAYGDGSYLMYLEKNKSTNANLLHVNGTIKGTNVTSEFGQLTSVPQVEKMVDVNLAVMREELKNEIYAELAALNAGIVVPVVMNGSHNGE